jgi:hypothetical protein
VTSGGLPEAEGPVNGPTGWFEQPLWTVLGVRMLVAVPGRRPFTTTHLVAGEQVVEVGTGIPVDVHPTRGLFRLVSGPSTGAVSR